MSVTCCRHSLTVTTVWRLQKEINGYKSSSLLSIDNPPPIHFLQLVFLPEVVFRSEFLELQMPSGKTVHRQHSAFVISFVKIRLYSCGVSLLADSGA
ncbi:hypothetical protein D3C86_2019740 [compost metagenome]